MKRTLLLVGLLFIAFSNVNGQGLCDTMYWHHTYLNERLKIYDSCVTITATIDILDPPFLTGDGDYHIYTTPDAPYTYMVNYRTAPYKALCLGTDSTLKFPGCLNVEEICKGTPTDTGYDGKVEKSACSSTFNDTVYLPNIGEHVLIQGTFIYDTVHCWNEIHPVSTMALITGINEINGAALADGLKIFPQPADDDVKFQFNRTPQTVTLVKIYTVTGKQLFVYGLAETNTLDLDVSSWPTGTYLYSIVLKNQNEVIKNGKFIVTH